MEDEEAAPHLLRFRDSELNETHSRYDNIVAGGSDHERYIEWIVYASIALTVTSFVSLVLIAILRKPEVRRKSFNLFLICLMIPDVVFSLLCGINCVLNAANGDYISAAWCRFQVFYCVWGIGSNAWLNGTIAYHIYDMLRCGKIRKRYFPPTRKRVVMESMLIYIWMAFLACWPFIDFMPVRARLSAGIGCLPHEYDLASTLFMWLVYMPLFALIPTIYTLYVTLDVIRRKLLPSKGRQRDLAVYFFRLVLVFLVMWLPTIILMFVAGGHLNAVVSFIGGSWSHLQGGVSAVMSVMKQDIGEAFLELITCGRRKRGDNRWHLSFSFRAKASQMLSTTSFSDVTENKGASKRRLSAEGETEDDWVVNDDVVEQAEEGKEGLGENDGETPDKSTSGRILVARGEMKDDWVVAGDVEQQGLGENEGKPPDEGASTKKILSVEGGTKNDKLSENVGTTPDKVSSRIILSAEGETEDY